MYIFMHYEMITINLIIICPHTNYDCIIDHIPYALYYIPVAYLFYYWRFVPLNPLHLFNPPIPSPLTSGIHQFVLCICESVFILVFCLNLFLKFHIYVKTCVCLSLTYFTKFFVTFYILLEYSRLTILQ